MLGLEQFTTPSKLFLIFWLSLAAGAVLGNYFELPTYILVWLLLIWLVVVVSGHEPPTELASFILLGATAGFLLWQLTDGETWFHWSVIGQIGDKLTAFRQQLSEHIFLALPEPDGSLLAGILFGNRVQLDADLIAQFRRVGLSHIIAVSGYNLTILTANAQSLLKPLIGRSAVYASFALIIVFVLMTGAPASILRAAVMASLLLIGTLVGRPTNSVNLLVLGAGVLMLFEPKIIFEVGFQLSVAATYGLVRVAPIIKKVLSFIPSETLRLILAETLGATIMTAPIIITIFEQFSLVSPLSNLLILPLVPLLMALGIIGSFLALVAPGVGQTALFITWPLLEWIIIVTKKLSSWQFSSLHLAFSNYWAAAIIILFIAAAELGQAWAKDPPAGGPADEPGLEEING